MAWSWRSDKPLLESTITTTINSLWPSNAIGLQKPRWPGSTLVEVMVCCLTALSHYLNQCWHSPGDNFEHIMNFNLTSSISESGNRDKKNLLWILRYGILLTVILRRVKCCLGAESYRYNSITILMTFFNAQRSRSLKLCHCVSDLGGAGVSPE